jgi:hypothetical protein
MAERMEIQVDIPTQQAVRNLAELITTMDSVDTAVSRADRSIDKATESTAELGGAARSTDRELKKLGEDAGDSSRKVDAAGEAAKKTGEKIDEAGDRARRGGRKIKESSDEAASSVDKLATRAIGMTAAFFGLQRVNQLVNELNDNLRRVIETRAQLGEERLTFDQQIQDIIDNLGLRPDPAGQARARKFVQSFQQQTGVSAGQAKEILSAAQGSGFNIIDVARPDRDTQAPGFAVAAELGRFASRTRLDAATAGQFLKVAAASGVTDVPSMQKLLAQTEQASQRTAINQPADFIGALLRGGASQITQGVPYQQVLASLASTAATEPNPLRAGADVEQFQRVAAGMSDEYRVRLARLAQQQRRLTPGQIAQAGARIPETEKQITLREEIAKDQRELSDVQTKEQLEATRTQEDIRIRQMREAKTKDVVSRQQQQIEIRRAQEDSAERKRQADQRVADLQQRVADRQRQLDKDRTEAGLNAAYGRLSPTVQQQVLRGALEGLPPEQRQGLALQVASSEYAQTVLRMTSPTGAAAFSAVQAGATAPDVGAYEQRNAAFRASTISQAQRSANQMQAATVDATRSGAEFANNLAKQADADIRLLQQAGQGQFGEYTVAIGAEASPTKARTEEGLKAKRQLLILQQQVTAFRQSLDPRLQAKYAKRLGALSDKLNRAAPAIMNDYGIRNFFGGGNRNLKLVQDMATEFGSLVQEIQQDAINQNIPLPTGFENQALPASGATATSAPATQPTSMNIPLPAGAIDLGPIGVATGESATAAAVGAGVTINIHEGIRMVQSSAEFDLPGRLETSA